MDYAVYVLADWFASRFQQLEMRYPRKFGVLSSMNMKLNSFSEYLSVGSRILSG